MADTTVIDKHILSDKRDADWTEGAKDYENLASKVPIVVYFSDCAAGLLFDSQNQPLSPASSFLDMCAGPATFGIAVIHKLGVEAAQNIKFIMTDYSQGMVDAARVAVDKVVPNHPSMGTLLMDVQSIDFPSDSQDVVGCMFGYFVPDRKKAFSELCRVSKATGKCVIGTWKYAGFIDIHDEFLRFLGKLQTGEDSNVHGDAYACSDRVKLEQELRECGFKTVEIHEKSEIFPIPLTEDVTRAMFDNPMVKDNFTEYSQAELYTHWMAFVRQVDNTKHKVDLEKNVLYVEYAANICIANK